MKANILHSHWSFHGYKKGFLICPIILFVAYVPYNLTGDSVKETANFFFNIWVRILKFCGKYMTTFDFLKTLRISTRGHIMID